MKKKNKGYNQGYNEALDDIFLILVNNNLKGVERIYPPEALLYVFKKLKK